MTTGSFIMKLKHGKSLTPKLRDRNAVKRRCNPLCCLCRCLARFWANASFLDRAAIVAVVLMMALNGLMEYQIYSQTGKLRFFGRDVTLLRGGGTSGAGGDPAPVAAPAEGSAKEEAAPTEDPKEVAAAAAEAVKVEKFAKPADCSVDIIAKVQATGMEESECRGQAYTQKCSFTILTRNHRSTWLEGYLEEVRDLRSGDDSTFVGAVLGDGCDKIEDRLHVPRGEEAQAEGGVAQALRDALKRPTLFCNRPRETEVTARWGLVNRATEFTDWIGGETLDGYMHKAGGREAIKDAIFIDMADGGAVTPLLKGKVTLARTRYVEFAYDWKGAWENNNLQNVVESLDELGFTCFWAGEGKLWRITGCWQYFYSFRSWSNLACTNRNLAPKLSEKMEKLFMKTIGSE